MRSLRIAGQRWLTPLQTDADAAFRERTLRISVPIFILMSLSQAVAVLVTPGIPNSRIFTMVFLTACVWGAALLIPRGRLNAAAGLIGLIYLSNVGIAQSRLGYWSGYMFLMIGAGILYSWLVFKRPYVIAFSMVLVTEFAIIAVAQNSSGTPYLNPLPASAPLSTPGHAILGVTSFILLILGMNTYYHREFNRRAQRLNELVNTLETRVMERTTEIEAANQQLVKLASVKDRFVANVSHELRTPIANLKLRYYLLDKTPHLLREHLAVIERETDRLEHIIEGLLTLSRLDQERITFNWTILNLNELAEQFVTDRRSLADDKELILSVRTHPTALTVRADPGLIGQALSVLLTNALHYTPPHGHVAVQVAVCEDQGAMWSSLAVIDNGPGILPEEQDRLFERFFRGSAAHNTDVPGTGLGLSILKEIVDRHGGKVKVSSSGVPGEGAQFSILLPSVSAI